MKIIKNIWAYNQGWIRYRLYYSRNFARFMRPHIREQIKYRISVMNRDCYVQGSCIKCGCSTPALQMANKICDGSCYPEMMSKKDWRKFQTTDLYNKALSKIKEVAN